MMDYRDLQNRLRRNQEILREREHDRLVALALQQHPPRRREWLETFPFGLVRRLLDTLKQTNRPQPDAGHRVRRPGFEHR
jgi:hypothetical protein